MLMPPEAAVYGPQDVEVLLDRACAALARYGTPRAWRALVDHGLKAEARLGSTVARLAEAGRQDPSGARDVVDRLLAALGTEVPRKVRLTTRRKTLSSVRALEPPSLGGEGALPGCTRSP